jgi:hypothetical protein
MIGIIGGGFGLYGWLPALCQFYPKKYILICDRHKEKFDKRPELQQYKDRIIWSNNDFNVIQQCNLLILAIPPDQVYQYKDLIIHSKNIDSLIVEKPICETPEKSEEFIKDIEAHNIKICSSYLFLYTDWVKNLNPNKLYSILWVKGNPNQINSWKHNPKVGGNEIFYKIHLLALEAQYNIETKFIYSDIPEIDKLIILNITDSKVEFSGLPFKSQNNEEDNRIPALKQLLYDFENNYEKINKIMKNINQLWKQIKQKSN